MSVVVSMTLGALTLISWAVPSEGHTHDCDGCKSLSGMYVCDRCDGSKHDPVVKCRNCSGSGWVKRTVPCDYYGCTNGRVQDKYGKWGPCPKCSGKGSVTYDVSCPSCDGWGKAYCTKCGGTGQVARN